MTRVEERGWLALLAAPVVVFLGVFALLFIRQPTSLTIAEFWADDGTFFTHALDRGMTSIAEPWGGSLQLVQRAVVLTETWVPVYWAPLWGNLLSLILAALVAAFLATRLPLAPGRRLGIAFAFVLAPATTAMFGTMASIQWILGAFLLAYAFASRQRTWELVPLAFVGLNGPLVLFVLPFYVGRWFLDRAAWRPLIVLVVCAAVQGIVLLVTPRMTVPADLALAPEVLVTQATHMPVVAGVLILALIVLATGRLPRAAVLGLFLLALAVPLAGMLRASDPTIEFLTIHAGARYFWVASTILVAVTIAAPSSATRSAALALMVLVFATEAIIPAPPVAGWSRTSACIGGPDACLVPVTPQGDWGDNWAVRWTPRSPVRH